MSPSTASVPPEVETALVGRYNRKVHVLDGLYHLWSANAVEHVKVGAQTRARVVGAVMSCGAVERDGAWSYEWAHRAIPVEEAAAAAAPCPRCFFGVDIREPWEDTNMPGDRGALGDFIDRCVLADRIERMAQACIDHPGLVATPEFDQFVDDLRGLSEDLAAAFVRTVHDGLSGNLPTEVQS